MRRRASVLVGLLWCLAILALIVVGVLHTSRIDLKSSKNYGDSVQAYYLALAGAEKAKALIYHDAASRKRSAQNHSGSLFSDPADFKDVDLGRGQFRVIHQGGNSGGGLLYGVTDEESRLNVNEAGMQELTNLYAMTAETAAAIIDWRDHDNNVSQGGAESEYYSGLRPPFIARNDRIQTARELLMVSGVSPQMLLGEDTNANGLLDPEEDDGDENFPPDNRDGNLDAGWSASICFESNTQNTDASGQSRVDLNSADEAALTGIPGITSEIAKAIVAWRGQNKFQSISDLLDVTELRQPPNQPAPSPGASPNPAQAQPQAQARPQPAGPKLINEDLFLQIADQVTTASDSGKRGLININSAAVPVLMCLPRITRELATAIVNYRSSAGYFANIGYLLKVPELTREIFKGLAPKVTARSETFRIVSEGKVTSSGARRRIEMIVQLGNGSIDTISYRENL